LLQFHGLSAAAEICMESTAFQVRPATPQDVPSLVRMGRSLLANEKTEDVLRITQESWLRNGFGPNPRITAYIAEHAGTCVGMITCSERYYTGWPEPTFYVSDMWVEPPFRRRGVARALLGRVAAHAIARGSPMIELTVQEDSPARNLYRSCGFDRVRHSVSYVAGTAALAELAIGTKALQGA
jgi:ribosomal protein S18 acetylase RimI-like enzyme